MQLPVTVTQRKLELRADNNISAGNIYNVPSCPLNSNASIHMVKVIKLHIPIGENRVNQRITSFFFAVAAVTTVDVRFSLVTGNICRKKTEYRTSVL